MDENELRYRRTAGAIGLSLIIFLAAFNLTGLLSEFLNRYLFPRVFDSVVLRDTVSELTFGAFYLFSFLIPIPFLKARIRKNGYSYRPVKQSFRLSPYLPILVFALIAVVLSAAYFNSAFVLPFEYSDFTEDVILETSSEQLKDYQIVLEFIVGALIPGVCEELLFRGAILTNCLPFGRSNAILISAFLFAMMHQNAAQTLYAFLAGIVLGLVYERTGNIWNCTILHVMNNFLSLVETVIAAKYGSLGEMRGFTILEGSVVLLGVVSIVVLIFRFFRRKTDFSDGIFEKQLAATDGYAECPIAGKRALRLFLSPAMIIFLVCCVLTILLLLVEALFYV